MTRADLALLARTGSHAYGTSRPDSDDDYRGVFVTPRKDLWRLQRPADTFDRQDPDITLHEVAKFANLAAKCNPMALEVLWIPPLEMSPIGLDLITHRHLFLSTRAYKTYGGYAAGQLGRALKGTGGSRGTAHFRREKFLLHTIRLLEAGIHLLRTGEVMVRVPDPDALWALARQPLDDVVAYCSSRDTALDEALAASPLPDEPDYAAIDALLIRVREQGP